MSIINLFRMASKFAISHRLIVRVVEHQLEADIVLASLYLSLSLSPSAWLRHCLPLPPFFGQSIEFGWNASHQFYR